MKPKVHSPKRLSEKKHKGMNVRRMACQVLYHIMLGAAAEETLESHRQRLMDPRDRDLLTELVQGVLRYHGFLDYYLHMLAGSTTYHRLKPQARILVRIGLYQLMFMNRIPDYASVSATVEAARGLRGISTRWVNAILREAARSDLKSMLPSEADNPVDFLAVTYSMPRWIVRRWLRRWGEVRTRKILVSTLEKPVLYIHSNPWGPETTKFQDILAQENVKCVPVPDWPGTFRVKSGNPTQTKAFQEGFFMLQDLASMTVTRLVDAQPGQTILDACAAPGVKSASILEQMERKGRLILMDIHPKRLKEARTNLDRWHRVGPQCKPGAEFVCANGVYPPLRGTIRFDHIFVDAPCSSLGVVRRHPDIKWRITSETPKQMGQLQEAILDALAPWVKLEGTLIYSVCTHEEEETFDVVRSFLEKHPDFRLEPLDRGTFPIPHRWIRDGYFFMTYPDEGPWDAFFAVVLRHWEESPDEARTSRMPNKP